ncbi:hypothetical protein F511_20395 [Dorcoceras hygrometricum]|uniref:Uncharacterized protein n=1 Tax=Dorcoceras hygrometricum TaxID=472368 RepID=A0A2Z7AMG6_9LAMI|nr:hypothetical protein F511_20395 [Dorcoceras hygrometricum]
MAASFFVNAMQVDFESVLAMEHAGMVRMFKTLEDTWLKGTSSKKKEMKIEYHLLHDIVAKALCAKAGSFDVVTNEKFDLMVEITAGFKVNWAQVLFQVLVAMVNNPNRQSQGFVVQLSVLLERLVKEDLGELVKLHPQKVLTKKSVHTYIKKNMVVGPAGETSKVSGAMKSEQHSTMESIQSLTNKAEKEAGEKQKHEQKAGEVKKLEKTAVEKKKKKKEKDIPVEKKQKIAVQKIMEARSQAAPVKSKSGTSSEEDSCPLAKLKKGGAKCNLVVESSDLEATMSVPPMLITKKYRTKRTKKVKPTAYHQAESQPGPIPDIPAGGDKASIAGGPDATMETTPDLEPQVADGSTVAEEEESVECSNQTDMEPVTNEGTIVVWSGPEQPAQQSMTFTRKGIFAPVEIREIKW